MVIESKDTIKRKMIRNASALWGYPDMQDINSFDPIVGMLMGALADELHKIAGDIEKTDARIVEKLIDLIFRHNEFSHFPAHAIVRAKPVQATMNIKDSFQFFYTKRIQKESKKDPEYENVNVFFTPTGNFNLFNSQVKYIASGDTLFQVNDDNFKDILSTTNTGNLLDPSKLFIGIEIDKSVKKLDGISLYFDIKNKQKEERFYQSLSSANWTINNKPAEFKQGLLPNLTDTKLSLNELFKNEINVSIKTSKHVNNFYNNRFMTLTKGNYSYTDLISETRTPDEIQNAFPHDILEEFSNNLFWIVIQLPQIIPSDIAKDVICSVNCFPVINRKLNEFTQSLHKGTNVIPLNTEDLFFDVRQVVNSKGNEYTSSSLSGIEQTTKNSYIIRQGGIARFDSRDAKAIITHLTDLIRDESAAFSMFGTEMISSELKQLDQIITRLKHRLESADTINDIQSYILLQTESGYERAFVKFWSAKGELANNIKSNSRLNVFTGSDFDHNSTIFMTTTFGGRQKLTKEDKLNVLRRTILSKGRIVTVEDIKALCYEHFGKILKQVEIKKGAYLDPDIKKGITRTMDIHLSLDKQTKLPDEELQFMIDDLLVKLKENSSNLLPFRVFYTNK